MHKRFRIVIPVFLCATLGLALHLLIPGAADVARAADRPERVTPGEDARLVTPGKKMYRPKPIVTAVSGIEIRSIVAWNISPYSPRASWSVLVHSPTASWRPTYRDYYAPPPPPVPHGRRRRASPRASWKRGKSSPRSSIGALGSTTHGGAPALLAWIVGANSPSASWSPDGSRVVFYDGVCLTIRKTYGDLDRSLRAPGGDSGEGGGCRSPRWSPDGKRIVTSNEFHGPAMLFDVASGRVTSISPRGDEGLWDVSFSADGKYLIGRIHQTGVVLVRVAKPDSPLALVSPEAKSLTGYFPSFSPDGRHAVRTLGDWESSGSLEVLDIDLRRPRRARVSDPWSYKKKGDYDAVLAKRRTLVSTGGAVMEHSWDARGEKLAFVESRWYGGYGSFAYPLGSLKILDVKSGRVHSLGVEGRNPALSPGGTVVAYDDGLSLWVVSADGGTPRMLREHAIEPRWSPDGGKLLFQNPNDRALGIAYLEP